MVSNSHWHARAHCTLRYLLHTQYSQPKVVPSSTFKTNAMRIAEWVFDCAFTYVHHWGQRRMPWHGLTAQKAMLVYKHTSFHSCFPSLLQCKNCAGTYIIPVSIKAGHWETRAQDPHMEHDKPDAVPIDDSNFQGKTVRCHSGERLPDLEIGKKGNGRDALHKYIRSTP